MKHLRFFALSLCAIGLAGCQTFNGLQKDIESLNIPSFGKSDEQYAQDIVYDGNCPGVEAVEELSALSEFTDPTDQSANNLISRIEISNMQSACNYDENSVTVDLRADFQGMIGPQGRSSAGDKPSFSYPFFVAVTSSSGKILAKEIFSAALTYAPGQVTQTYTEKMRQIIPLESRDKGSKYKVLVGLQLTPDQLAYNRQQIIEEQRRREEEARRKAEEEKRKAEEEKRKAEEEKQRLAAEKIEKAEEEKRKAEEDKLLREAEEMEQTEFEKTPVDVQEQTQKEIYIGRPVDITP
jgi:predicted small secreted protein